MNGLAMSMHLDGVQGDVSGGRCKGSPFDRCIASLSPDTCRRTILRLLSSTVACEKGSQLIEYAIILPALMFMLLGILGIALLGYNYHFTAYAARQATRYAMVRGSTWGSTTCDTTTTFACNATAANVQSFVQGLVTQGISSGSALTVTTTWPGQGLTGAATKCTTTKGVNSPGCLVKVTVSYSFNYNIALLPTSALTFGSSSQVVVIQ
jgi:Flp pilus assembly protein TadG